MTIAILGPVAAGAFHWAQAWEWTEHTLRVLTALGTAGAVIVAVGLALARWVFGIGKRPMLTLSHNPATDVSREQVGIPMLFAGEEATINTPAGYLRLGVANGRRRHAASGVEVLVIRVEAIVQLEVSGRPTIWEGASGKEREPWKGPAPKLGRLAWTHVDPPELTIGPGIRKTVDLGYAVTEIPQLRLAVSPPPLNRSHALTPGTYRLTLAVGGANADAQHYTLTLWFDGDWEADKPVADHMALRERPYPRETSNVSAPGRSAHPRPLYVAPDLRRSTLANVEGGRFDIGG
jgi:hypothetical protein